VGELGELAVPDTLHALIAARLDGLDPAERSLIQDAAVLGQSFTPSGLGAVSGLEPAVLTARLRVLVRSDLILEEVDPRSPERGQYHFVQALIREVAYSTLSLKDRRSRHLAAARFFEGVGDDELAGALAAHYVAAYRATSPGDEAKALATQARIALKAAADRALALGSPRQAVTFLAQALEVEADDADRATILERTIQSAIDAAMYEPALDLVPELREIRERMGDRSGLAKAVSLQGQALADAREREQATTVVREALPLFEGMDDDPNVLRMRAGYALGLMFTRNYEEAGKEADRTLAIAERLGNAEIAVRMLRAKGMLAQFEGRMWEAIALLEGSRRFAEQLDLSDEINAANSSLANVLALDDPRGSVAVGRKIIEGARRIGHRGRETINLGNTSEDVRRTGEWDWVVAELDRAIRDEDRNVTDLFLEHARAVFLALRGTFTPADVASIQARTDELGDPDMSASMHDLLGVVALTEGRFVQAAREFMTFAEGSDLNAPYALPRAGVAAVLGQDATIAKGILDRLGALGTRGRAIETDIAVIRAGILAIEGDHDTAMAGYRVAWSRYIDLGLVYDQGLLALVAASTIGSARASSARITGPPRASWTRR
jgi:tetratricopeptide (TPR) repeat protein